MEQSLTFIFILCLAVGATAETVVQDSVIFQSTNDVTLTRSRWMISFIIDVSPFDNFLQTIKGLTKQTEVAAQHLNHNATSQGIKTELDHLESMFDSILYRFAILKLLFPQYEHENDFLDRIKRFTLFPFLGEVHAFLYGTVTKADLEHITESIENLERGQSKLFSVLENAITYINATRIDVRQNRLKINDLIDTTRLIAQQIKEVHDKLYEEIKAVQSYAMTYAHYDLIISEIRDLVYKGFSYLQNLELQLAQLSSGDLSPNVISPEQLLSGLLHLQEELPPNLRLPYDPVKNLFKYYEIMDAVTVAADYKLIIVTTIPLYDLHATFSIYHSINLPIPYKDTNLTAKYTLESDYMAVSSDQRTYAYLSQTEFIRCSNHPYCTLGSPIYPVEKHRLCVMALFLRQFNNIKNFCEITVKNLPLPIGQNLGAGDWLIITNIPLDFNILCTDGKRTFKTISPPLGHVELGMSCTGSNRHMTLTPFYNREIDFTWQDDFKFLLDKTNLSSILRVWEPFERAFPELEVITVPPHLKDMDEIPLHELINDLQSYTWETTLKFPALWVLYGVVTLLGVALLGYFCIKSGTARRIGDCCLGVTSIRMLSSPLASRGRKSPEVPSTLRDHPANVRLDVTSPAASAPHLEIYPELDNQECATLQKITGNQRVIKGTGSVTVEEITPLKSESITPEKVIIVSNNPEVTEEGEESKKITEEGKGYTFSLGSTV